MAAFIDRFRRACGSSELAWLIIANVVVFLLVWAVTLSGNHAGIAGNFTLPWLCVPSEAATAVRRAWTAVTYMLTHYDFLHLLFNMLWLYMFGLLLYPAVSGKRLLVLFGGGGLAGSLLYVAVTALWPGSSSAGQYLCGASAAVLAVMTCAALVYPDRRINLLLIGPVKLKWVTLCCIVLTFFGIGGGSPGAGSAHVGGVVFGAAYALIALRRPSGASTSGATPSPSRVERKAFVPRPRKNVRRDGDAVAEAAAFRLSDSTRLDQLLDKIRLSGYASLTTGERNELNELSQRLRER